MAKMKKTKYANPFLYQGYVSPEYFCDRIEETEELIANLNNGRNTTLISPRRIGKTGLILNTFHHIKATNKEAVCIYIDIFATKNLHEFVETLGKAVIEDAINREKSFTVKILDFLKGLRPTITPDLLTGMPTVSVTIASHQAEYTLKSIFTHLDGLDKPVYLAIDEFQQISGYPEKGTEALLRSYIQFIHNVKFIFSGSKQHIMAQMFFSPGRPFYQSTATIGLSPLHEEIYYDFARKFFEAKQGSISAEIFHDIYERFDGVTQNVQQLLNRLYETELQVNNTQQVNDAIQHIINRNCIQYETLIGFLTDNQLSVLKAIAKNDIVQSPLSSAFIKQHDLPSSSSVKTALTVLIEKDIVYHQTMGYQVYDRFFNYWLKKI